MPIVESTVDGVDGLTQEVLRIARQLPAERFLWYRGQGCHTYQLIPKLMRDGRSADEVFEREARLLTRFRQRSMAYWPAGYPQNNWEHLFAMQHFGMPTRLLDWSENLFVAAHFAINKAANEASHQHGGECDPILWMIDPIEWNRATPVLSEYGETVHVLTTADDHLDAYSPLSIKRRLKSPIAIFGAHNSGRIVAQRGTFMVWGNDPSALEQIATAGQPRLWRVQVRGDREVLAQSLRQLGFGETMIFPELPSLGAELSRSEGWKA